MRRMIAGHKSILGSVLLVAALAGTYGEDSSRVMMEIRGYTRAQPPRTIGQTLVLSYQSESITRFVGARFEHESFAVLHPYSRTEAGVFVLAFPLPFDQNTIKYRIVVDGLWMRDPLSTAVQTDLFGIEYSVIHFQHVVAQPLVSPEFQDDGTVTFHFVEEPGKSVFLAGDFNGWDPFVHRLRETEPGRYSIKLPMTSGRHFYVFHMDGRRLLDPMNPDSATSRSGLNSSSFLYPL